MSTNAIVERRRQATSPESGSLDEYISSLCLTKTIGDVVLLREAATNARAFFATSLIFHAVFDKDMGALDQIANRIDGTVPDRRDRDRFANIMGDALEDVLEYARMDQTQIFPDDPTIIALAKTVLSVSWMEVGRNPTAKKDRQKAIEMVLQRTGGRKTEPTAVLELVEYVDPDWMAPLPAPANVESEERRSDD